MKVIDPTGIPLTPGDQGKDCLGNGRHPEYECCCDECDYYLSCFPQYDGGVIVIQKTERTQGNDNAHPVTKNNIKWKSVIPVSSQKSVEKNPGMW